MPVNLAAPEPHDLHPVAGVASASRGRRAQGQPQGPDRRAPRRRRARWPACSRRTASARRRCRCAASTWRAARPIRALVDQHRQRQRRHRRRRPGARARDLRGAGRAARRARRAGAAVLDRRDHGAAAGRAHRGRAAGGARRLDAPTTGSSAAAGHHDHRHPAEGVRRARSRSAAQPVTITGISKGAGMIRPNMATMLGFLATDAAVAPPAAAASCVQERPTARSTASRSTATPRPTIPSC